MGMLVLTRSDQQSVFLNDRTTGRRIAEVKVLGVTALGTVRLGFEASDDVSIIRDNMRRDSEGKEIEDNG